MSSHGEETFEVANTSACDSCSYSCLGEDANISPRGRPILYDPVMHVDGDSYPNQWATSTPTRTTRIMLCLRNDHESIYDCDESIHCDLDRNVPWNVHNNMDSHWRLSARSFWRLPRNRPVGRNNSQFIYSRLDRDIPRNVHSNIHLDRATCSTSPVRLLLCQSTEHFTTLQFDYE